MKKIFYKESGQVLLFLVVFSLFFPHFYEKYYGLVFNAIAFFLWFPDYVNLKRGTLSEERKLYYLETSYIETDMLNTYLKGIGIAQVVIVVNFLIYYKLRTVTEISSVIEIFWFVIIGTLLIIYLKILNKKCERN